MSCLKRYLWIIIVVIIIITICVFPLHHNIDITLQGMQCRIGDMEYAEEKSISIKGTYRQYLIKTDIFDGRIEVEGYDFTFDEHLTTSLDLEVSVLNYMGNVHGKPVIETLGTIFVESIFSKILICISEPTDADSKSWIGEDNALFISAPAYNRNQAIDIAEKLKSNVQWKY